MHKNIVISIGCNVWWFEPLQTLEDTHSQPHRTVREAVLRMYFHESRWVRHIEIDEAHPLQKNDELCQCWCVWYAVLRVQNP